MNHLSTRRKRKQLSDSVSSGERTRKSLNLQSVKPAGVALRGSWDLFGGDGSRPGELQSERVAEEFGNTLPESVIAAYAKRDSPPFEQAPE